VGRPPSARPHRGGAYTPPSTIRNYVLAANAVIAEETPIAELDTPDGAGALIDAVRQRWGSAAASTFNAKCAALRSFLAYCRDQKWLAGDPLAELAREHQAPPAPRARSRADINRLLRDSTQWALIYESGVRIEEVLPLDVDDLDLRNSRARTTLKGCATYVNLGWPQLGG
jgi:site-specific recombinase XerD